MIFSKPFPSSKELEGALPYTAQYQPKKPDPQPPKETKLSPKPTKKLSTKPVETKKLGLLGQKSSSETQKKKKLWSGNLKLVHDGQETKFKTNMYYVNGDGDNLNMELLNTDMIIGGRIKKDDVWKYITAIKRSKQVCIVTFHAASKDEAKNYMNIMQHLQNKDRFGVIVNNKKTKDFYIVPISADNPYPKEIDPNFSSGFEGGPGIEFFTKGKGHQSMLLGIIVRHQHKLIMGSNPNSPQPYGMKDDSSWQGNNNRRSQDPRQNKSQNTNTLKLFKPKPKPVVFQGTPPGSPPAIYKPNLYTSGIDYQPSNKEKEMMNFLNSNSDNEEEPPSTMANVSLPHQNSMIGSKQNSSSNLNNNLSMDRQKSDTFMEAPPTPEPYDEGPPELPSDNDDMNDTIDNEKSTENNNPPEFFEGGMSPKFQPNGPPASSIVPNLDFSLVHNLLANINNSENQTAHENPIAINNQVPEEPGFESANINDFIDPNAGIPPEMIEQNRLETQKRLEEQQKILSQKPVDENAEVDAGAWAVMDTGEDGDGEQEGGNNAEMADANNNNNSRPSSGQNGPIDMNTLLHNPEMDMINSEQQAMLNRAGTTDLPPPSFMARPKHNWSDEIPQNNNPPNYHNEAQNYNNYDYNTNNNNGAGGAYDYSNPNGYQPRPMYDYNGGASQAYNALSNNTNPKPALLATPPVEQNYDHNSYHSQYESIKTGYNPNNRGMGARRPYNNRGHVSRGGYSNRGRGGYNNNNRAADDQFGNNVSPTNSNEPQLQNQNQNQPENSSPTPNQNTNSKSPIEDFGNPTENNNNNSNNNNNQPNTNTLLQNNNDEQWSDQENVPENMSDNHSENRSLIEANSAPQIEA